MLAISLRPRVTRNPKHLLARTSRGFKVAKVNLPPIGSNIKTFLEGKEDWLEEGLLVLVKKY
jgi:hypothetical protein